MRLDEFESVFRSAIKPTYELRRPPLREIVVLTDEAPEPAYKLITQARAILSDADTPVAPDFRLLSAHDRTADSVLSELLTSSIDLLVTHRHVLSHWRNTPYALGSAMSIFVQTLPCPVLMLPLLPANAPAHSRGKAPETALVATRHLIDDSDLVDWALHVTGDDGTVVLGHVEDESQSRRYLDAIGRIRGIDTDIALTRLPDKLLQLSRDYTDSVVEQMQANAVRETLIAEVRSGDPLVEFAALIAQHSVDLLVVAGREHRADPDRTDRKGTHGNAESVATPINGRSFALALAHPNLPALFV